MSALPRSPLWLFSLALAAFAVQTDDFVLLGVLPQVAADTGVSVPAAGQLVTVYSLVYALGAPLWACALARIDRVRLLVLALAVFTAANLAVPFLHGYPALLGARVLAAAAAAAVLPAALAAAGAGAPLGRRGRYLAWVMTGTTGAVLAGVPLGTWIGQWCSWPATFVFVGVLGGLAALPLRHLPPEARRPPTADTASAARVPVLPALRTTGVAGVLLVTVCAVCGNLAFQTYLAPFLREAAGVGPTGLGALLVGAGAAGMLGTRGSGRLVDRLGGLRTFTLACGVFGATMALLALVAAQTPRGAVPLALSAVLLACWSAAAWAIPPALQALLLDRVPQAAAPPALAVQSSAVYVGAALGGAVGGAVAAVHTALLPATAGATAVLALLLALVTSRGGEGAGTPSALATREQTG